MLCFRLMSHSSTTSTAGAEKFSFTIPEKQAVKMVVRHMTSTARAAVAQVDASKRMKRKLTSISLALGRNDFHHQ